MRIATELQEHISVCRGARPPLSLRFLIHSTQDTGWKGIREDLPLSSHRAKEPMESMGNRLGEGTGGYGTEMAD